MTGGGGVTGSGGVTGGIDATLDVPAPIPDGQALLGPGKSCTADTDCALGGCVDGVCCSKSKANCGGCNACTKALTGLDDGTCGPVSVGKVAHNACTDETATKPCGNDGTCDGTGACRNVGKSKVCVQASCSTDGKTFTPTTTCDGAGACTIAVPESCAPFQCTAAGCPKTCAAPGDCVGTNYCNTSVTPSVCAAKKTNGSPASQGIECTSGVVADGVCCDKACSGCSACTLALNKQTGASVQDGQCLAVAAGQAGHSTCTASPPCGLDGTCDGNGSCRYTATNTSCATDACTDATLTSTLTTKACDSTHTCVASTNACPGSLKCASPTACKKGSCTVDGDCISGEYCGAGGTCTGKKNPGDSCSGDTQCADGHCVANICCKTACGECNSCTTGTCTPVAGVPACGTVAGKVCVGGACVTCAQGATCTPTNTCKTGTVSCTTGSAVCQEDGGSKAAGTPCTGGVCYSGSCQIGCYIGNAFVGSGAANQANQCQVCTPTKNTGAWSNNDTLSVPCGCSGTQVCTNMTLGSCSKPLMTFYQDYDGDGYGDKNVASPPSCSPPLGYVANSGDCDDHDANWYPGTTECNQYVDPNSLITCDSNGTDYTSTCPNGCAGGQCRAFTTVNVAGSVTCGALVCPATPGCGFPAVGNQLPTCEQGTSGYYETCDGPSDCPGQVCCHVMSAGSTEHTACMANGACPYGPTTGGSGRVVCDSLNAACATGGTCQIANSFLSIYECK